MDCSPRRRGQGRKTIRIQEGEGLGSGEEDPIPIPPLKRRRTRTRTEPVIGTRDVDVDVDVGRYDGSTVSVSPVELSMPILRLRPVSHPPSSLPPPPPPPPPRDHHHHSVDPSHRPPEGSSNAPGNAPQWKDLEIIALKLANEKLRNRNEVSSSFDFFLPF